VKPVSIEVVNRRGVLRAVVVDSEPLWRDTLAAVLKRLGVGMIHVCESSGEVVELISSTPPHLVLLDAGEASGVLVELHRAQRLLPHLTTVLVARNGSRAAAGGLEVAASVNKCSELEEIEAVLHDVIRERLEWATLTPRELQVLTLVRKGASNREVAKDLWLSDQTVKFHLANAYRKLGVKRRGDAVGRADELGLLPEEAEFELV